MGTLQNALKTTLPGFAYLCIPILQSHSQNTQKAKLKQRAIMKTSIIEDSETSFANEEKIFFKSSMYIGVPHVCVFNKICIRDGLLIKC